MTSAEPRGHIGRDRAAELGREALSIIKAGRYSASGGQIVDITELIRAAVDGTRSFPPGKVPDQSVRARFATRVEVQNETTLAAAQRLCVAGLSPAVLNLASATHPGGGFLSGARAQEEYLARSSALYACIENNEMYAFHRDRGDPLYTDYTIYSPAVPVFRADDHTLLPQPYTVAVITAAAVNANRVRHDCPERETEIIPAMQQRIHKVLAIGAAYSHTAIVLGAWGCGVFGNDAQTIAQLFQSALHKHFQGVFQHVVFAIVDWSEEEKFIGPFRQAFKREEEERP